MSLKAFKAMRSGILHGHRLSMLGLWAMFVLVITPVCAAGFSQALNYKAVANREAVSNGMVGAYHPEDHARYDYTFHVGANYYSGRGYLGVPLDKRRTGSAIRIFYDPSHPGTNSPDSLQESSGGEIIYPFLWFVALGFVLPRQGF